MNSIQQIISNSIRFTNFLFQNQVSLEILIGSFESVSGKLFR